MTTTAFFKPPPSPPITGRQPGETPDRSPSDSEFPPFEERLEEIVPLIGFVPVAGPPVFLVVGPWVLFALMLTGPFLLLVTFVLAALILVAIVAGAVAPAYLLVRHVRRHRASQRERHLPGQAPLIGLRSDMAAEPGSIWIRGETV